MDKLRLLDSIKISGAKRVAALATIVALSVGCGVADGHITPVETESAEDDFAIENGPEKDAGPEAPDNGNPPCTIERIRYLEAASWLCDNGFDCSRWGGFSPPLSDPENPLPVGYRQVGETVTFMISDELCRGIQDELN
jgi:hypothetical protein